MQLTELDYYGTVMKYWLSLSKHLDGLDWTSLDGVADGLGLSLVESSTIHKSEIFKLMRVPVLLTRSTANIITAHNLEAGELHGLITSIEFGELQESVCDLCSLLKEVSKTSGFT